MTHEQLLRAGALYFLGHPARDVAAVLNRSISSVSDHRYVALATLKDHARARQFTGKLGDTASHGRHAMTDPIDTPTVAAIKTAVAAEAQTQGLTEGSTLRLLDSIDAALAGDGPEVLPFAVGSKVEHRELPGWTGVVIERREHEGALHSLLVRWEMPPQVDGVTEWQSPRELEEAKP